MAAMVTRFYAAKSTTQVMKRDGRMKNEKGGSKTGMEQVA